MWREGEEEGGEEEGREWRGGEEGQEDMSALTNTLPTVPLLNGLVVYLFLSPWCSYSGTSPILRTPPYYYEQVSSIIMVVHFNLHIHVVETSLIGHK